MLGSFPQRQFDDPEQRDPTDYGSDDDEYQQLLLESVAKAERDKANAAATQGGDGNADITMS